MIKNLKKENSKGITLIALVVTIIVLLILASISIATLTGDNRIISQAQKAKEDAEIADEKEVLGIAAVKASGKDKWGEITEENLGKELNKSLGSENYNSKEVEEGVAITFAKSNRTYLVDSEGNVIEYIMREPEAEPEISEVTTLFQMLYGVIEIEFLNGTGYTVTQTPNVPILRDGMEAVYWTDSEGNINTDNPQSNTVPVYEEDANYNEKKWYEYTAQTGREDGKTSRWANATTSDGSYYVWIPRYAYRIIYFDTEPHEEAYRAGTLTEEEALEEGYIVGYSDARGIVDSEGKRPSSVVSKTAISVNDKYFRTHPVFEGKPEEGGWDSKLEGIWVMKYEASKPNASPTSNGNGTIPMSVPSVKSWTGINVSTMFTYARDAYNDGDELNTTLNSHLMKNSEWGAVAYLLDSKYGRNGTEISVNQCSTYITGAGRGLSSDEENVTGTATIYNSTYEWNAIDSTQKYDGIVGQLSSSTGNIYGIYDISGDTSEFVMGFYQDEEGNIITGNLITWVNSGFNGLLGDGNEKTDGIEFPTDEREYYQIYPKTSSDGKDLGDALYETKSWNSDYASFVGLRTPVFLRGGWCGNNSEFSNGVFFSNYTNGSSGGQLRFPCMSCSKLMCNM